MKKFGIVALFLVLTGIVIFLFDFLLRKIWLSNNNVTVGIPFILALYFWGGYFLRKEKWLKGIGIFFYTLGVLYTFIMLASPYDSQKEFIPTRIFLLFGWAAGIYLICRKSWTSRIFGIIVVLLTLPMSLLGSMFMYDKLNP